MSSTASSPTTLDYRSTPNFNEASMDEFVLFSDSLKDLRNLSKQLHSAAEYFELSYMNDDQKQMVFDTLKDYAVKALVNTVDHLGSVTYKVDDLLDNKVNESSETELRLSCIEQRLRTCQKYTDHEGISQQCLAINAPMYHKRYVLPVRETMYESTTSKKCGLDDSDGRNWLRDAVGASMAENPIPNVSKGDSPSQSLDSAQVPQNPRRFSSIGSMSKKELEKRAASPRKFSILRSGSFSGWSNTSSRSRPVTPSKSRPATPNKSRPTTIPKQHSDLRKSVSMRVRAESEQPKIIEQQTAKSKRIFKALLGRSKAKKDDMLYTFLDEY